MSQRRNRRAGVEDRWTKTVRMQEPDGSFITTTVPSQADGKGKRWRARYVGPDGKERAKAFARMADARAWLDKTTTDIGSHTWVDPSRSRELFGPTAEAWFATKATKEAKTVAGYRSILDTLALPRWADVRLVDITHEDVQTWISGLSVDGGIRFGAGLSPSRVIQTYQVLNMVIKYAIRVNRLIVNPCTDVELPPISAATKRYLTHEQVQALAAASGRFRTLVLVLAYCGLRFGEAAALRTGNIDLKAARIFVRASATRVTGRGIVESDTKTHVDRKVPIPATIVELLRAELPDDPQALVFPGRKGGWLSLGEFRWVFDQAATDVGLQGFVPHELRHTCASLAIKSGANIKVLQTLLGHKTATMTLDRYGHLYPDELGVIADALDAGARSAADSLRTEEPTGGQSGV